jgi:hypothetical protein
MATSFKMAIDIERIAFEAYGVSVGGKTYDGKDIPKWENVGKKVQDAWRAAAVAVANYLESERQFLEKETCMDFVD